MFLSREIDIKMCQNYTKTHKCKIWYKIKILNRSYLTTNLQAVSQLTRLYYHWLKFWSRDTDALIILLIISIKNEKKLNSGSSYTKSYIYISLGIILANFLPISRGRNIR